MASIWNRPISLDDLNNFPPNLAQHIGIEFTECTDNSLSARMPVDSRTIQPYGILHGGASVVLAETLGSVASVFVVDDKKFRAVGLEINANHLRPISSGYVTGVCTPIHLGTKTHVWDIRIYTPENKMVCISRLTVAILPV